MKNLSTGTGLALLAGAIVVLPIIIRLSSIDQAAHAAPPMEAAKAIAAASTAQVTPTIVWYGIGNTSSFGGSAPVLFRAWSNGRVEATFGTFGGSSNSQTGTCYTYVPARPCNGEVWFVISDASQGYNAAADINFDSKVDGDDLGQLLAAWGDAPRHDIPPSDCPINLINP